jgi:hypothetical protein
MSFMYVCTTVGGAGQLLLGSSCRGDADAVTLMGWVANREPANTALRRLAAAAD